VTFRRIRDGAEWMSFRRVVFVDCTFETERRDSFCPVM